MRRGRLVKTSVRSSRACSERATVCSSRVLMWAPRSWWKWRSLSRADGRREDCWEFREFCGMGQVDEEEAVEDRCRVWRWEWLWALPNSSCCRLRSHRLTDRRESSASRRREAERTVVKERGRRQSGGTISLPAIRRRYRWIWSYSNMQFYHHCTQCQVVITTCWEKK